MTSEFAISVSPDKPRLRHDAVITGTPYYVLMDGNHRISPKVVQLDSEIECFVIYGFSDKGSYDKFLINSERALKPYPLVKGYLRNQAALPGDNLKLVVLDATGPCEPFLHAATIDAVLKAHEKHTTRVTAAYRLTLDEKANAYAVEEAYV